ncbi:type IV toxin-antitoxin system AbiEi family antitoxin domain-containing protein [Sphingobium olei]|uniref:Type IV toxin-antitoxin system AbiEi family antitoxin domain-containing protein n=1 Tax=Sphingobium olei TaxID=420955 RepID=A0ABW3NXX4_9SPHN
MISSRSLNRRNVHERQVIACLRGPGSSELRNIADGQRAFASLVTLARHRGVTIFPPDARFISDGEIELLANLAAAQRQACRTFATIDVNEFNALLQCAMVLRDAGIWLPMAGLHGMAAVRPAHAERTERPEGRFVTGIARARALSLVRSREVASTDEFVQIGVSRQYVSQLCKDGYIQRVRHGWYRAAPSLPRGAYRTHLHA